VRPYLKKKKNHHKKRDGGVVQDVGHEFKFQYHTHARTHTQSYGLGVWLRGRAPAQRALVPTQTASQDALVGSTAQLLVDIVCK
jgi:hypothetical protein